MKTYSILLMDADETLLDFKRSEGFALSSVLAEHGVAMTPAMQASYHEINRGLWEKLERREITRDRLKVHRFELLLQEIGLAGVDAAAFNERYMQLLGSRGFVLEGAVELLQALSARYAIYLITNGTACVQHTRLADSGLLPYVKDVFISQEVGADKPSPCFFDHVLHAIGDPSREEILVIGDSLTSDIRGGILSGLDTCWFNPDQLPHPEDIVPTMQVASYPALLKLLLCE